MSVALEKRQVKRVFHTLQQCLPIALRLAGIISIREVNLYLMD